MKKNYNLFIRFFLLTGMVLCIFSGKPAFAQPYGMGYYSALVPYGGQTSLTISTSGNIAIPITPASGGVYNSATGTVTVVSTDVVGYQLYIRALTTSNLVSGAHTIPTSANGSPAALAVDTWGYNLDGSTNYVGIATTDTLIKSLTRAS
jgi:hypothetical protein